MPCPVFGRQIPPSAAQHRRRSHPSSELGCRARPACREPAGIGPTVPVHSAQKAPSRPPLHVFWKLLSQPEGSLFEPLDRIDPLSALPSPLGHRRDQLDQSNKVGWLRRATQTEAEVNFVDLVN